MFAVANKSHAAHIASQIRSGKRVGIGLVTGTSAGLEQESCQCNCSAFRRGIEGGGTNGGKSRASKTRRGKRRERETPVNIAVSHQRRQQNIKDTNSKCILT